LTSFPSDAGAVGISSAVTTRGRLMRKPMINPHLGTVVRFMEYLLFSDTVAILIELAINRPFRINSKRIEEEYESPRLRGPLSVGIAICSASPYR
jgi:hypothetical protein